MYDEINLFKMFGSICKENHTHPTVVRLDFIENVTIAKLSEML